MIKEKEEKKEEERINGPETAKSLMDRWAKLIVKVHLHSLHSIK